MSVLDVDIYGNFNVDTAFAQALARCQALSNGAWTDTANVDLGVITLRALMEQLEEAVYSVTPAITLQSYMVQVGKLFGVPKPPKNKASGYVTFTTKANTQIPQGFEVTAYTNGWRYVTMEYAECLSGGQVVVPVVAVEGGRGGNQNVGSLTAWTTQVPSGSIVSITNEFSIGDGSDELTDEQYAVYLQSQIQNETYLRPHQFVGAALKNTGVSKVRLFRNTEPLPDGTFKYARDAFVMVLLSQTGGAVGPATLNAIKTDIVNNTMFNIQDGVHVLSAVERGVSVSIDVVIKFEANSALATASIKNAVAAYINAATGGQDGKGLAIGQPPAEYELGGKLENLKDVAYVTSIIFDYNQAVDGEFRFNQAAIINTNNIYVNITKEAKNGF